MRVRRSVALLLAGALAGCGPQDEAGEAGVGDPLPDTLPVTGIESDLPEGMVLPPETDTTRTQPY